MTGVMIFLCTATFVLLVMVEGARARTTGLSAFELKRRQATGDPTAAALARRGALHSDVLSLQRVVVSLLLVGFAWLAVVAFGWASGIALSVAVVAVYGAVAQRGSVRRRVQPFYDAHELQLFQLIESYPRLFRLLQSVPSSSQRAPYPVSREELAHIIDGSAAVLSGDEKHLLRGALAFGDKKVSDIMTPWSAITRIDRTELLGPLVLDGLHKTGHTHFPVTEEGNPDRIVGLLDIQGLLALDTRQSVTAGHAMQPRVGSVREDDGLERALAVLLADVHPFVVVVDAEGTPVGALSLGNILRALFGRNLAAKP
jgi:CBS domain containing-hemolysin-like protein